MAFISYVPYSRAGRELKELYDEIGAADGAVDNILRIHCHNPPSMRHHYQLYSHLMRGASPLTRFQRELIAVAVSVANSCHY